MVGRTGGEEDEVDGGVDPSGCYDVGLRRGDGVLDPPDGAAGPASAALPRVEPPQQDARVVHRRVPGAARQPREHQHQHHEDDERRHHRRNERREVHLLLLLLLLACSLLFLEAALLLPTPPGALNPPEIALSGGIRKGFSGGRSDY